jgi:hypothetical protein
MRLQTNRFGAIASFASSICILLPTYYSLASESAYAIAGGLLVAGFFLGLLLGIVFGRRASPQIGKGAFIAASLLWTPVVIGTYGFALMAAPLLVAYGALTAAGAWFGGISSLMDRNSTKPPDYVWSCLACEAPNDAGNSHCKVCGCSVTPNKSQIELGRKAFELHKNAE